MSHNCQRPPPSSSVCPYYAQRGEKTWESLSKIRKTAWVPGKLWNQSDLSHKHTEPDSVLSATVAPSNVCAVSFKKKKTFHLSDSQKKIKNKNKNEAVSSGVSTLGVAWQQTTVWGNTWDEMSHLKIWWCASPTINSSEDTLLVFHWWGRGWFKCYMSSVCVLTSCFSSVCPNADLVSLSNKIFII